MEELGIPTTALTARRALEGDGATVMWVAVDSAVTGYQRFGTGFAHTAAAAFRRLRKLGIRTVLLTRRNRRAARAVGTSSPSSRAGGAAPRRKGGGIRALVAGGRVAWSATGVNDAPALAAADGGVAMERERTSPARRPP